MNIDYELLITLTGINAIAALGFYLTLASGQLSLAHGAMYAVGGYAGGYAAVTYQVPFVLALVCGFLAAALLGGILAFALQRTRGLYFGVATFAFGAVVVEVIKQTDKIGGSFGYGGIPNFTTLPVVLVVLALVILAMWAFDRSPVYVAYAAARIDQDAALVMGINVRRARGFAFGIGGGLAGMAGTLYAGSTTIISPANGGFSFSLALLLMVIIGGSKSWRGAVLGAVIWTALPELLRAADEWRMVVFGVAAIVLVAWRPDGLIPRRILSGRLRQRMTRSSSRPTPEDVPTGVGITEIAAHGSSAHADSALRREASDQPDR